MFGNATLEIPQVGDIGPSRTEGLSDALALTMGRIAAWTLRDRDGFVIVTFASGEGVTIGYDEIEGGLVCGRLGRPTVIRPTDLGW